MMPGDLTRGSGRGRCRYFAGCKDPNSLYVLQGVANRDIKLENTLLDGTARPLIKICDYGYSKVPQPHHPVNTFQQQ